MRYEPVIRRHFDVVGTSGSEFLCRCPWHKDGQKPNLYVNREKGVYCCHSCGQKGHLKSVTSALPPPEAADIRARIAAMAEPPPKPTYYPEGWLRQFDFPHPAWEQRGFSPEVITKFKLGYDPFADMLTIPFRNVRGRIVGVIQRRLDNEKPKYRYPKWIKIGHYLFAAWMVRQRHRRLALVEGSIDAVACWDARCPAVALLGSRMTTDQVKVLQRLGTQEVVIMTDRDTPGQEAIFQIHGSLVNSGIAVSVGWYRPYWTDVKDPADLTIQRRRKMFHSSVPYHRWLNGG